MKDKIDLQFHYLAPSISSQVYSKTGMSQLYFTEFNRDYRAITHLISSGLITIREGQKACRILTKKVNKTIRSLEGLKK